MIHLQWNSRMTHFKKYKMKTRILLKSLVLDIIYYFIKDLGIYKKEIDSTIYIQQSHCNLLQIKIKLC